MTDCIRRAHSLWTTCPCDDCTRDRKRLSKLRSVGLYKRVSSDEAWEVLAAKIDAGWTAAALGSATGLDPDSFSSHVAAYRKGRRTYIGPVFAQRVVTMGRPTEGQIGAVGTRRRLRALARIGHGLNTVAAETGVGFSTLGMIRRGNARVSARIAGAVSDAYDRLHMTVGDDVQAVRHAIVEGWAPPLAYDDDIDDPNAEPVGHYRPPTGRRASHVAARIADLEHFIGNDMTLDGACRELGVTRDALWKWADRHQQRHLYERLARLQRRGGNQHTSSRSGAA